MNRGFKKLADIENGQLWLRLRLSGELEKCNVDYLIHPFPHFVRYFVKPEHLCCARTILKAVEAQEKVK